MTSDLSKITNGVGPSAVRLKLLIGRAFEPYSGIADMPCTEQRMSLRELNGLLAQITEAASFCYSYHHAGRNLSTRQYRMTTVFLFVLTAVAEILGCYLPYRWLRESGSIWLLIPSALSLALFAWLLSLHPTAAGRTYAAYGGVYIAVAVVWLWAVEGIRPTSWDWFGVALTLAGMAFIAFQPR